MITKRKKIHSLRTFGKKSVRFLTTCGIYRIQTELQSYQNQLIQLANPHEIPMTKIIEHNFTNVLMLFAINRHIDSSLSHLPDALKTLNSRIIFCYHFSFSTYSVL